MIGSNWIALIIPILLLYSFVSIYVSSITPLIINLSGFIVFAIIELIHEINDISKIKIFAKISVFRIAVWILLYYVNGWWKHIEF